ncbi:RluA family pseudouridine synthase [Brevibacillus sp. SYSU BS000544]|uniref:RluA family pseudouridine synthase n=1 Tax=Brevibacillus sp. SYSU BS000544 TaxID=3416443 RepID=UPI003CE45A1B
MSSRAWLEYVVTEADAGMTVEQIVREKLSVSGRMLQRLTRSKGIQLNRKAPFLKRQVKVGDRVAVRVADQTGTRQDTPSIPFDEKPPVPILYEDDLFVIVDKPSGMPVHPTNQGQTGTLTQQLEGYFLAKRATPHAVHRLDKETSGTVLIAKSSYAHQLADKILRDNQVDREYIAIVTGQVTGQQGTLNQPIARDPHHATKRRVHASGDSAITHYEVITTTDNYSLVKIKLETGRTHQIRVHLQAFGHPLAGDTLYGAKKAGIHRVALHANRLTFAHPVTNERVDAHAPLPLDMASFVQEAFPSLPSENLK